MPRPRRPLSSWRRSTANLWFTARKDAVAKLGKRLIVRQDGKGDFKNVQAAIDAAPRNSLIEVHDSGLYRGGLVVPSGKSTMRRGAKGCFPVITSAGVPQGVQNLLVLESGITLERLVLAHANPGPQPGVAFAQVRSMRVLATLMTVGVEGDAMSGLSPLPGYESAYRCRGGYRTRQARQGQRLGHYGRRSSGAGLGHSLRLVLR
jgi:hypothetical protein